MLAFLGAVVQEAYTFPWYKNAPALFTQGHDYGAHNGSLSQVLLWCSFFEIMTLPAVIQMVRGQSDRKPGEFGLDLFGMMAKDPIMAQKEIKVCSISVDVVCAFSISLIRVCLLKTCFSFVPSTERPPCNVGYLVSARPVSTFPLRIQVRQELTGESCSFVSSLV